MKHIQGTLFPTHKAAVEETEVENALTTASEVVNYFFPDKTITKKVVKADEIVFYVKGELPIHAVAHTGRMGQYGIVIRKNNIFGKAVFDQFFSGITLS